MHDFFADGPWYLPVLIALAAIVLLFQGNARQNRRMKYVGLALAGLAAMLVALSYFLISDREMVIRKTEEIATAVNDRDWKAFSERLDPDVRFFVYNGRDQFTSGAAKSAEAVGVKNISLSSFVVTPETGAYRVDFRAMADVDATGRRTPTDWRFYWSKDPASRQWLLYQIEYVPNPLFAQDQLNARLVKP